MNTAKTIALRTAAIVGLLVVVIAPPVGVAALIGRPYPGWSTLRNEIDQGQVTTDTTMRIAAALFIVVWIWIIATIAGEVFRIIAARNTTGAGVWTATPSARSHPAGVLRGLVRIALLGTVTTAVAVSNWSSAAVATAPTLSALTSTDTPISAAADPTETFQASPTTTSIVANGRITPLSIAVDLGDESLRTDIVAMNQSTEWTAGVFPAGMLVTVPIVESPATPDTTTPGRYVVQDNAGMWNVAQALLGDGSRHHELRALLVGQEVAPGVIFTDDTSVIHPGWVFEYPASENTLGDHGVGSHLVSRGDNLSSIAEHHLNDPDRWIEIWNLNANATMNDGRVFNDPNLILPGWELTLPPPSTPTGNVTDTPAPPVDVETTTVDVSTVDTVDAPGHAVSESSPTPSTTPPPAPSHEAVPAGRQLPRPAPEPQGDPIDPPPATSSAQTSDLWSTTQRSVWATLGVGGLLTAGLAVTIRRLRLRRLAQLEPGHRLVEPPPLASGTELAVSHAAAQPDHSTIHGLLRSLTPYVAEQNDAPAVRAVQIGTERVEVLFSKPAPLPPRGWTTIDGGMSWTHRFGDDVTASRQLLTPALVTIGIRTDDAGDEVLLDLETAGSLSIQGDRDPSLGLARSIALELATYPLGVPMDVCLIGLHVDGTELCDRVWLDTTMTRAIRVAQQRLERVAAQGAPTMIAARAQLDEDDGAHDPQIFIVDLTNLDHHDRQRLDELVRLCQPSIGTAVVVVGDHEASESITIDADGTSVWSGVDLQSPNVTRQAAAEAAVMLDHVANADTQPIQPDELMTAHLQPDVAQTDDDDGSDQPTDSESSDNDVDEYHYEQPPHDVVVSRATSRSDRHARAVRLTDR